MTPQLGLLVFAVPPFVLFSHILLLLIPLICRLLANVECNATASFAIAHFFLQKLVSEQLKGCIVFTSSVAGFIPTPFAASYAATKAFVSQLACSLHIEVQSLGIDVCAVVSAYA